MEAQKKEERLIFHVDVNSAFLSWSAVHRLEQDPNAVDLRTIPSIVGGDRATRHGIVTAKSIPAAKLGIRTADPVVKALQKCPDLVIVPSDFTVYRRYSRAFLKILRKYAPVVEQASIDEAYMDVTGEADRDTAAALARKIRDEVRDTLGFTVNVGISTNKLLAKMASDFEKPDKTHTLFPDEIADKMWPLPIGALYGCGRQTASRLNSLGIRTIGDTAALPVEYLQSVLGEKGGEYIWRSSNGISDSPVSDVREDAKSCSNEVTTPYDITTENYEREVPELIRALSDKVSSRLQKDGMYARTIGVVVKTSDFKRHSMQIKQEDSTQSGETICRIAMQLAEKLMLGEKGVLAQDLGVRLVGVTTADLDHGEYRQMNLMEMLAQAEGETQERKTEEADRARRQAEAEERAHRQTEEKERARRQAEAEERARHQAEAEELARRQAEEEARARQQAEAEERARQQAEAEELACRQAEEEERACQQAEAEERARHQAEAEELARREAEEAKRQMEEQKRKDKEERLRRMEQQIRAKFGEKSVRRGE